MERLDRLEDALRGRESLGVLFSGGLDSTLLARMAHDALGDRARALTFSSPIVPAGEVAEAGMLAELIGIPCDVLAVDEAAQDPSFTLNRPDRCYTCRKIRNSLAWGWAREQGIGIIADGVNASDLKDRRPGIRACREDGIWQPFAEFGITKDEIRERSRELGLPTWDKPSTVCLCSRIPFGMEITSERLGRVREAESFLRGLGFSACRVRHFPLETAVVEIEDPGSAFVHRDLIVKALRDLGFLFVTLDLEGFASGKLNRTAEPDTGGQ